MNFTQQEKDFYEFEQEYRAERLRRIQQSVKTLPVSDIITKAWPGHYKDAKSEATNWWNLAAWGMLFKWNSYFKTGHGLHVTGVPEKPLNYANQFLLGNKEYLYHWTPADFRLGVEVISASGMAWVEYDMPTKSNLSNAVHHILARIVERRSAQLVDYVTKTDIYDENLFNRPEHVFPVKVYRNNEWIVTTEMPLTE